MTAPTTWRDSALNLNELRRGSNYTAVTLGGVAAGEYLGMEMLYGDFAVLLRQPSGTESILIRDITSLHAAA